MEILVKLSGEEAGKNEYLGKGRKMKKILILANNDVGLYKFRKELIQKLIEDGYQVYISLPYGELVDKMVEMGCEFIETEVDRRGINPITDLKLLMKYRGIIKQVKPDVILTYTIKPNIYGGLVSRMKKIPYVVNITGLGLHFRIKECFERLSSYCIRWQLVNQQKYSSKMQGINRYLLKIESCIQVKQL